jgi:hypothetical protein
VAQFAGTKQMLDVLARSASKVVPAAALNEDAAEYETLALFSNVSLLHEHQFALH